MEWWIVCTRNVSREFDLSDVNRSCSVKVYHASRIVCWLSLMGWWLVMACDESEGVTQKQMQPSPEDIGCSLGPLSSNAILWCQLCKHQEYVFRLTYIKIGLDRANFYQFSSSLTWICQIIKGPGVLAIQFVTLDMHLWNCTPNSLDYWQHLRKPSFESSAEFFVIWAPDVICEHDPPLIVSICKSISQNIICIPKAKAQRIRSFLSGQRLLLTLLLFSSQRFLEVDRNHAEHIER